MRRRPRDHPTSGVRDRVALRPPLRVAVARCRRARHPGAAHRRPRQLAGRGVARAVALQRPGSGSDILDGKTGFHVQPGKRRPTASWPSPWPFSSRKPPTDLLAMFTKATGYGTDSQRKSVQRDSRRRQHADDLRSLRLRRKRRGAALRQGEERATVEPVEPPRSPRCKRPPRQEAPPRWRPRCGRCSSSATRAYRAKGLTGIAPYDRGGGKSHRPGRLPVARATTPRRCLLPSRPEVVTALLNYPRVAAAEGDRAVLLGQLRHRRPADDRPDASPGHDPGRRDLSCSSIATTTSAAATTPCRSIAGIFPVTEGALVIYANRTFTDQLGRLRRQRQAGDRPQDHGQPARGVVRTDTRGFRQVT